MGYAGAALTAAISSVFVIPAEAGIQARSIRCIDLVLDELAKREGDEIHQWAKAQDGLFMPLTEDVQSAVKTVLASHQRLIGIGSGRSGADPFVIALAMVHGAHLLHRDVLAGFRGFQRLERRLPSMICDALGALRRCDPLLGHPEFVLGFGHGASIRAVGLVP